MRDRIFDDLSLVRRFIDITDKLLRYRPDAIRLDDYDYGGELPEAKTLIDAGLLSSNVRGTGRHIVCIDVDHPVLALPSSTPGHWHLLIDIEMEADAYRDLLAALTKAGVVEPGYAAAANHQGATYIRTPWVLKSGAPPSRERAFFRRWVGVLPGVAKTNAEDKKLGRAAAIERASDA